MRNILTLIFALIFWPSIALAQLAAGVDYFVQSKPMGSLYYSPPKPVIVSGFSVQAVFTGNPNGILKIQTSNNGVDFSDILAGTYTVTAAGSVMFNIISANFAWFRLAYLPSSGNGTLDGYYYSNDSKGRR